MQTHRFIRSLISAGICLLLMVLLLSSFSGAVLTAYAGTAQTSCQDRVNGQQACEGTGSGGTLEALEWINALADAQGITAADSSANATGDAVWRPIGPEGGTVTKISVCQASPSIIYMVMGSMNGPDNKVFKSVDGGSNWSTLTVVSTSYSADTVAVDPNDPDIVYAIVALDPDSDQRALLKSVDGGVTWQDISSGLPVDLLSRGTVVIDSVNSQRLFLYNGWCAPAIGCSGFVYESQDGGGTWTKVSIISSKDLPVYDLKINGSNEILVATTEGLFRSTDGGGSWIPQEINGLAANETRVLAVAGSLDSVCFAVVNGKVLKKEAGAGSGEWMDVTPDVNGTFMDVSDEIMGVEMIMDPADPGTVFLSSQEGLFRTRDGGTNWTNTRARIIGGNFVSSLGVPVYVKTLALLRQDGHLAVYAGTSLLGLFKSVDAGDSWTGLNKGLHFTSTGPLAADDNGSIYSGSSFLGLTLYKSDDQGNSWKIIGDANASGQVEVLAVNPREPSIVFAGTYHMDPLQGSDFGGLYKSTDGGASWTRVLAHSTNALAIDSENGTLIYAGTVSGIYVSVDGGISWEQRINGLNSDDLEVRAIALDPTNPETVYAATSQALFKSVDGGASWVELGTNMPDQVRILKVDPVDSNVVYAGFESSGLLKSNDGGLHWTPVNSGLANGGHGIVVTGLVIDGQDHSVLYLSTGTFCEFMGECTKGSLYKSTDGGSSWTDMSQGITGEEIIALYGVTGPHGRIYAATRNKGIFEYELQAVIGDVSGDGEITIVDALFVARHAVNLPVSNFDESKADVNCDGKVNIVDALLIARKAVGLPVPGWCKE